MSLVLIGKGGKGINLMESFNEYARIYNALYWDKDYRKEAEDVDMLLKKYGVSGNSLCVFGCGTGRHDAELSKLGYKVHGIDLSETMIEMAKKEYEGSFEVADIRDYISNTLYDAVISIFHVMSYQNTNQDVVGAIESARRALKPGGIFLFDAWYGPGVLTDRPSVRVNRANTEQFEIVRIANPEMLPNDNIVKVNYDFILTDIESRKSSGFSETHSMRFFFKPELESALGNHGFELLDCLDCKTLGTTDFSSWTAFFVARAK